MTGRPGLMLIREGSYALALLPGPVSVRGVHLDKTVEVQGDILPGAVPLLIVDLVLLSAGVRPQGLAVAQVVET